MYIYICNIYIYICVIYIYISSSPEFGSQRSTGVPASASWLGSAALKLGNSEATVQRLSGDFGS